MPPLALGAWRPLTDTARLLMHCDRCVVIDEAPDSPRQPDPRARATKLGKSRKSGGRPEDCAVRKNSTLPIARQMVKGKSLLTPETC